MSLTLENVGSAVASDTRVHLASTNADLRFGQAAEDSRYVGPWEPGQERTVSYVVTATEAARAYQYSFQVSTTFEDDRGRTVTTKPETVGVTPLPDLDFAVRDVSSNLAVGEEATIRGTLVNDGDVAARNAVVTLSTPSRTVALSESTYPVGDLEPGASAPFAFDVAVAPTAEDGPRSFSLLVAYEDDDGDAVTSDSIHLRRQVAPQPDRLELRPVNATFGVDTSNRLTVEVTNVGDEPLTDVQARLAPQPPFSSEAPTSYVARLEPGETVRMAFELTVSEDAVESDHAVAVNVTADTPDDRTVLTGPHLVPVTIAEESNPAGQEGILIAAVVVVAVVIGAGYWWLRQ
ncbi:COG1361 S-layer family protein [Halobacteriaceae archaeon GCM10025711]